MARMRWYNSTIRHCIPSTLPSVLAHLQYSMLTVQKAMHLSLALPTLCSVKKAFASYPKLTHPSCLFSASSTNALPRLSYCFLQTLYPHASLMKPFLLCELSFMVGTLTRQATTTTPGSIHSNTRTPTFFRVLGYPFHLGDIEIRAT